MDVRKLDMQKLVAFLVDNAAGWIADQRERHAPGSEPLPDTTRAALKGYFEPATLARTRIRRVPVIENPVFYEEFENSGESIPLDFRVWAAITFDDVIVVNDAQVPGPPPHSVVFHELVHVVQFGMLGVEEFARRYIRRLAQSRFQYMAIPLETIAFDLQDRFENSRGRRFSAEGIVLTDLFGPESDDDEDGGILKLT
jgi:hypothetical protein